MRWSMCGQMGSARQVRITCLEVGLDGGDVYLAAAELKTYEFTDISTRLLTGDEADAVRQLWESAESERPGQFQC
jgi:hypothetical protein